MSDDFSKERRQHGQDIHKSHAQPSSSDVWAFQGMYLQRVLGHKKVEQLMSYSYLEAEQKKKEFREKGVIGPMDVGVEETGFGGFEISYEPKISGEDSFEGFSGVCRRS